MGTNYYLVEGVCDSCGQGRKRTHIGKSSCGWCFSLHVRDPKNPWDDDQPADLAGWIERWKEPGTKIVNEYDEVVSPDDMLSIVTERSFRPRGEEVPFGYKSWAEFDSRNYSKEGPCGLLRHTHESCISHPDGTYDLIVGEFS